MLPRDFINLMAIAEKMKCNARHSWTSTHRQESVAEHSWRLSLMAYFVQDEFPEADIQKVILMCIFHDLGEAITGDIPAFLKTSKDESIENLEISRLIKSLPQYYQKKLTNLFQEMNDLVTLESKIYKALDKMEAIMQHNEADISTWLPLEYELNLSYDSDEVKFSPYMENLKKEINNDSLLKIRNAKQNIEKK